MVVMVMLVLKVKVCKKFFKIVLNFVVEMFCCYFVCEILVCNYLEENCWIIFIFILWGVVYFCKKGYNNYRVD